jgi:alkylation response protein AidB-like acyl-CoA dehydrogenase
VPPHPLFTEEHDELRAQVRRFVESELQPHALDWERDGDFPNWVFKRMGDLGLLGLRYPTEYGGQGGDWSHAIVLAEELARIGSAGVGMAIGVQTEMATPPIERFGTEEQKQRYLVPSIRGEKIACLAITEPDAGSDVANIQTTAVRDGDEWVINGRKMFITNGRRADYCLLVARTDKPAGYEGFSLFLVDTDLPGFEVSRTLDKLGMRASDTAELVLDDVRVPADALLGEKDKGFYQIMWELQGERMVGAAGSLAGAWLALQRTIEYTKQRQAFGRPVSSFQVWRHRFAEMATEITAAQQLLYDVAVSWERGEYPVREVAMLKLYSGLVVNRAMNTCLQAHGGAGYAADVWVERAWRDTRLLRIGAGADEVMREIIGRTEGAGEPRAPGRERPAGRFADIPRYGLFTEAHDDLRAGAGLFVERRLHPHADEWERAGDFPVREVFREAGQVGLFGAKYEEAYGGTGPDLVADALITEELVRCSSGGVAAAFGAHKDLATWYVYRFGSEEQRQRWLTPSVAGELIGALAITEPDAGSDVASLATRAVRDGDDWVLSGTKTFVTNGPIADYVVVAARTEPDKEGADGISLIVVDRDSPGFSSRRLETVGWRTSHTGELTFDGCRVPGANLLGERGRGFHHLMQNLHWERLVMALAAVAAAARTLEMGETYADERHAFGRPLGRFQVWRHRFADLATEIEAARSLAYHALRTVVAGEDAATEIAMAKWFATELDWKVADEVLQVHGGYGYVKEFTAERAWRDARLGPIGGGTTEIMKELVGRGLGL